MSAWILIQILVNIVFLVGFLVFWSRLKKPPQEDPRLSRGLQLLQNKISVLEDLSDRTETQVNQLTALLEQKSRQLAKKMEESERQVQLIEQATQKSLQVADIFQDKIPHAEIVERQNTIKYVQAARLAHQGLPTDKIAEKVDLPVSELAFISKINKDQLMFDAESLPEWAKKALPEEAAPEVDGPFIEMNDGSDQTETVEEDWSVKETTRVETKDFSQAFDSEVPDLSAMKKIDEEFKQAVTDFDKQVEGKPSVILEKAHQVKDKLLSSAENILNPDSGVTIETPKVEELEVNKGQGPEAPIVPNSYLKETMGVNKDETKSVDSRQVKIVRFPKIDVDLNDNLS